MTQPLTILEARLVSSTLVACATLLGYDYLCTFDQEVAYIWNSPWSVGKSLFLLNRYLPFIDTFVSLRLQFTVNTAEACDTQFRVVTWFIVIGIIISELILILRTYALWERKRGILILLCISSAGAFIPAIVTVQLELASLRYVDRESPSCHITHASPIIIVAYVLLMLEETTIAILTGIKAVRHLRHSRLPWVIQLYRDGLFFYTCCLLMSIANVLVPILLAPSGLSNWLATPQRVVHSVLCTRVLLLILKQRSASNMTNRLGGREDAAGQREPIFTSFFDSELSTNMTIMYPVEGEARSITTQIPEAVEPFR